MFFLNLRKGSNQQELDNILKLINGQDFASHTVTKAAFSHARKKLSHTSFIDLNYQIVDEFYQNKFFKKWHGHRLCAIDGSQFRLPNEPDIVNAFGLHKGKKDNKSCSMALTSVYYDVLNEIIIDSCIKPPISSERELASQHLLRANKNDLVLLDRNYPVFWLYSKMCSQGLYFCMRARDNVDILYKQFRESGQKECLIEVSANINSIKICQDKKLSTEVIKLRLIRVELKNEVEILITNLVDKKQYPACIFKALYHLRWGIEECYKRQKSWLEIENFSGKSALSVRQDYYAKIVTLNLTSMMVHESQKIAAHKYDKRRLKYKINFAQALSKMKDSVVILLLNINLNEQVKQLCHYIAETVEAIRNDREFKHNANSNNKKINHLCYKRCR